MTTRTAPAPTHTCNVPGCQRQVRREHWACDAHWWIIPLSLRNALSRAWLALKTVRRAGTNPTETLKHYRTAEKAILEWFKRPKAAKP